MKRISQIAASALVLGATSAYAGNFTIVAKNGPFRFDPPTLEIHVGDTVTFMNDPGGPGFHNVESDADSVTPFRCADGCDETGGNGNASASLWTATVTFPTAGEAGFHCEVHGGSGMTGTITIVADTAPVIEVDTTPLAGAAEAGASATLPLAIGNSGTADLDWSVDSASTDCATPDAVPWLSLAPTSGTVVAGDPAATVDVTMDAAALDPGVYDANVCVHSNDATNALVSVPVEFTVSVVDEVFADGFDPQP